MRYIKLQKDDNISISNDSFAYLSPNYVYLPCQINKLLVKQNSKVLKQEAIDSNLALVSPISGEVIGLSKGIINNKKTSCLVIKNDFKEKRKSIKKKNNPKMTIDFLLTSIEAKHYSKLLDTFKNLKSCKNIIINTIEDEPYTQNGITLFKNNLNNILDLMSKLSILYHSKLNTIIVKENEKVLIEDCINTIGSYPNIKITLAPNYYLLGQEEYLLKYLRYDSKNTLYLNIVDAYNLFEILNNNEISTSQLITISGDGIEGIGKVIEVKKYSNALEVINNFFKLKDDVVFWVNGLMQGYVTDIKDIVITEDVKVINIMQRKNIKTGECFNCGKCVEVCPKNINPISCYKRNIKDNRCINCGLCNYICPVYLDLKTRVFWGK